MHPSTGYRSLCLILLVLVNAAEGEPGVFSFANMYDSNMVLQKAPQRAVIRGYAEQVDQEVSLEFDGFFYEVTTAFDELGFVTWTVSLEPTNSGGPYDITAVLDSTTITLTNVMFGDVYFCSGQSNMARSVNQIDDPEGDIADSVNYPDVRFIASADAFADVPFPDADLAHNWRVPDGENIRSFSAVCWFFGKRLYESLGYPIGLIHSSVGGTRIEAWSSPEALDACFPDGPPPDDNNNAASVLWNAMVYPFLSYNVYGVIWYQGEANRGHPDDYPCSMSAMVSDWRHRWLAATEGNTDPEFAFGQVQLAAYRDPDTGFLYYGWPALRWAQTYELGYTPNEELPNVYTAVAMDLPDFEEDPIHPRWKRQVADRLWVGALQLGYSITTEGRYQGPYPSNFILAGNRRMEIDYDNFNVELEFRDLQGATAFEMCCSLDSECEDDSTNWQVARVLFPGPAEVVLQSPCPTNEEPAAIRYAWTESPCPNGLENCAIYSANSTTNTLALPAPPFIFDSSVWN